MSAAKTRFEKVSLEEVKKILPAEVQANGNHSEDKNRKPKTSQQIAVSNQPKRGTSPPHEKRS